MGWAGPPAVEAAPGRSTPSLPPSTAPGQRAQGPAAASPGSRKVVLVAMLISCRCSSVSVWKRRMEEPEEKAIQTPLPAFTMWVTLTASSWCASKLCCGTVPAEPPRDELTRPRPNPGQNWKETSEAQQWWAGKALNSQWGAPSWLVSGGFLSPVM